MTSKMFFKANIDATYNKFGMDVKLRTGSETVSTKAFVEPLRYRTKLYIGGEYRKLGKDETYLYTGKAGCPIVEDETIVETSAHDLYKVVRVEDYIIDGVAIYTWALLKPLEVFQ